MHIAFISRVGGRKYELWRRDVIHYMGAKHLWQVPTQWDPSLLTTDPIFQTNANYTALFNQSYGYIPSYNTAAGSATAIAL